MKRLITRKLQRESVRTKNSSKGDAVAADRGETPTYSASHHRHRMQRREYSNRAILQVCKET